MLDKKNKRYEKKSLLMKIDTSKLINPSFQQLQKLSQKIKIRKIKIPSLSIDQKQSQQSPVKSYNEEEISKIVHNILKTGNNLYMNMKKNSVINSQRAITPKKIGAYKLKNMNDYFGRSKNLSTEQRQRLNFLDSQLKTKQNQLSILDLRSKYMKEKEITNDSYNKLRKQIEFGYSSNVQLHKGLNIRKSKIDSQPNKSSQVLWNSDERSRLKNTRTKQKKKNIETQKQIILQIKNQQLNDWITNHKNERSKEKLRQLKKIEKYSIPYHQYLKKKSEKEIEKRAMIGMGYSNQTLVKQYQTQLLNKMKLGSKLRENIVNVFESINKQARNIQ